MRTMTRMTSKTTTKKMTKKTNRKIIRMGTKRMTTRKKKNARARPPLRTVRSAVVKDKPRLKTASRLRQSATRRHARRPKDVTCDRRSLRPYRQPKGLAARRRRQRHLICGQATLHVDFKSLYGWKEPDSPCLRTLPKPGLSPAALNPVQSPHSYLARHSSQIPALVSTVATASATAQRSK